MSHLWLFSDPESDHKWDEARPEWDKGLGARRRKARPADAGRAFEARMPGRQLLPRRIAIRRSISM